MFCHDNTVKSEARCVYWHKAAVASRCDSFPRTGGGAWMVSLRVTSVQPQLGIRRSSEHASSSPVLLNEHHLSL